MAHGLPTPVSIGDSRGMFSIAPCMCHWRALSSPRGRANSVSLLCPTQGNVCHFMQTKWILGKFYHTKISLEMQFSEISSAGFKKGGRWLCLTGFLCAISSPFSTPLGVKQPPVAILHIALPSQSLWGREDIALACTATTRPAASVFVINRSGRSVALFTLPCSGPSNIDQNNPHHRGKLNASEHFVFLKALFS